MRKLLMVLLFCSAASTLFGQDQKIKFGKISPEQAGQKIYSIDSHAHAVVLSDVGSTSIVGNSKGGFSLEFKRHRRVHILNKNAYDEADIEIDLYTNDNATEKLENLKAATYNLEGGKIVEAEFEKDNLFTEKRSRHLVVKKFTLPNVKEGSVIEYEYKITSDFLTNLQPWTFQERDAPVLWSEYKLSLPGFLDYVFLSQGFQTFH